MKRGMATRVLRILLTGIGSNRLAKVPAAVVEVPAGDQGLERCGQPHRWSYESILALREADPYLAWICQTACGLIPLAALRLHYYSLLLPITFTTSLTQKHKEAEFDGKTKARAELAPQHPSGPSFRFRRGRTATLSKPPTTRMCCSRQ